MADYIEREAVMAILEDHPAGSWRGYDVYTDEVRAIMREVEELPAACVAPVQWISVDDRLPDDDLIERQVICVVRHRFCGPYVVELFWWGHLDSHWQSVTHWMPLPEPPEED